MPRKTRGSGRRERRTRPQRPKDVTHGVGGEQGEAFRCVGCRLDVPLVAPGTAHRNHCPHCLASRHVDGRVPGDRAASCRGRMVALSLTVREDGEWVLIHQCQACAALKSNRIAGDDNALTLMRLALRPLADARLSTFSAQALLTM